MIHVLFGQSLDINKTPICLYYKKRNQIIINLLAGAALVHNPAVPGAPLSPRPKGDPTPSVCPVEDNNL